MEKYSDLVEVAVALEGDDEAALFHDVVPDYDVDDEAGGVGCEVGVALHVLQNLCGDQPAA
jgi:hypothetical protein